MLSEAVLTHPALQGQQQQPRAPPVSVRGSLHNRTAATGTTSSRDSRSRGCNIGQVEQDGIDAVRCNRSDSSSDISSCSSSPSAGSAFSSCSSSSSTKDRATAEVGSASGSIGVTCHGAAAAAAGSAGGGSEGGGISGCSPCDVTGVRHEGQQLQQQQQQQHWGKAREVWLGSYMSAFKAANPGSGFLDFMTWLQHHLSNTTYDSSCTSSSRDNLSVSSQLLDAAELVWSGDHEREVSQQSKQQQEQEQEEEVVIAGAAGADAEHRQDELQLPWVQLTQQQQQQQLVPVALHPFLPPFDQQLWRHWFDCCYPLEATAQEQLLQVEVLAPLVLQLLETICPVVVFRELAEVLAVAEGVGWAGWSSNLEAGELLRCAQQNAGGEAPWMVLESAGVHCEGVREEQVEDARVLRCAEGVREEQVEDAGVLRCAEGGGTCEAGSGEQESWVLV